AVGRQGAMYDAVRERTGLAAVVSTALAVLGGVGLIGLVGIGASSALLAHMPGIDADQLPAATVATWIVAMNFAVALPLNVFDATLWGLERFDLLNAVDIATGLVRLVVTAMLLFSGFGLVSLAWMTLALTVLTGVIKAGLSWRFLPALRLLPVRPRRAMAAGLFRYGAWNLIGTIGLRLRQISAPMLIAGLMGVAAVTPFSIVARLVAYAHLLVQTGTGVLLPFASRLDACG